MKVTLTKVRAIQEVTIGVLGKFDLLLQSATEIDLEIETIIRTVFGSLRFSGIPQPSDQVSELQRVLFAQDSESSN